MEASVKPINLLLVDDDEDDYLIFQSIVAKIPNRPFKLHWCSSYTLAKKLIEENEYDLYLIDYNLGEKSGLELLEFAAPYKRAEPFIILTGAGDEAIERRAMRLGVADYLVKGTFNSELLSRTMRYALQRKQLEEQRLHHLIEVNRAKDEFISLASHQLRTPATGVKQYLGMLLEGFAGDIPPRQRTMLEKAYASNERQLHIVSDLLRVAQVDAGKVKLSKKKSDITKLVEDVLIEQQSLFAARKQKLEFKKPDRPVEIEIDAPTIRMVVENIVDNASKYSHEKQPVSVEVKESTRNVLIIVRDEGVGISPEDQKKLFQKFIRINNPLSTMVGGSGLGLYWAKRIVTLHRGSIRVSARLNKGSTFTVSLPKRAAGRP